MNLRLQANADIEAILADSAGGFGWPITVTGPDGRSGQLIGFSADIGHVLDFETGALVEGRHASVTLSIAQLARQMLGIPKAIADENSLPWRVGFRDLADRLWTFKVVTSKPDRTVGIVVCELRAYKPGP